MRLCVDTRSSSSCRGRVSLQERLELDPYFPQKNGRLRSAGQFKFLPVMSGRRHLRLLRSHAVRYAPFLGADRAIQPKPGIRAVIGAKAKPASLIFSAA